MISNIKFNENLFSTDELATINHIYSIVQKKGKRYLFEKSHKEDAFKSRGYLETLDYEDAKSLKIELM